METAIVVLGLLAMSLAGLAVWFGTARARLGAELAAARAQVEAVERSLGQAREEVQRFALAERASTAQAAELGADAAALRQQLDAAVKAHQADRNYLYDKFQTENGALEQRLSGEMTTLRRVGAEQLASLERERDAIKSTLAEVEQKFRDVFGSLAGEALKSNTEQFMALAEQRLELKRSAMADLVKPIAETLSRTDAKLAELQQSRTAAEATLAEQVRAVGESGRALREETGRLVQALKKPEVRGRWGEIQLRRVAELAGMSKYCDFAEQDQTRDADGNALQPDMVVHLPSSRTIVVDAKTNTRGYIDAFEAPTPEEAAKHLDRFARHVADQASALARKKYWAQYAGSPAFVVMFIPGDQFIDAALSRQPELLERAAEQGVILASPSTLIGLLHTVAVGYREQQLAEAAEDLRELGKELHERAATAIEHAARLGQSLRQAIERYNDFVGSYEMRLEPVLRKFEDSGVKSGKELPPTPPIEVRIREITGQLRLLDP